MRSILPMTVPLTVIRRDHLRRAMCPPTSTSLRSATGQYLNPFVCRRAQHGSAPYQGAAKQKSLCQVHWPNAGVMPERRAFAGASQRDPVAWSADALRWRRRLDGGRSQVEGRLRWTGLGTDWAARMSAEIYSRLTVRVIIISSAYRGRPLQADAGRVPLARNSCGSRLW